MAAPPACLRVGTLVLAEFYGEMYHARVGRFLDDGMIEVAWESEDTISHLNLSQLRICTSCVPIPPKPSCHPLMKNLVATDLHFPLGSPAQTRYQKNRDWLRAIGAQVLENENVDAFNARLWFRRWRTPPVAPVRLVLAEHVWPSTGPGSTRQRWKGGLRGLWNALTSQWSDATVVLVLRSGEMDTGFRKEVRDKCASKGGLYHVIQLNDNMRFIGGTLWYAPMQVSGTHEVQTIAGYQNDIALVKIPKQRDERLVDVAYFQTLSGHRFIFDIALKCMKEAGCFSDGEFREQDFFIFLTSRNSYSVWG